MSVKGRVKCRRLKRRLILLKSIRQQVAYINDDATMNQVESIRLRILQRLEDRLTLYDSITNKIGTGPHLDLGRDHNHKLILITK